MRLLAHLTRKVNLQYCDMDVPKYHKRHYYCSELLETLDNISPELIHFNLRHNTFNFRSNKIYCLTDCIADNYHTYSGYEDTEGCVMDKLMNLLKCFFSNVLDSITLVQHVVLVDSESMLYTGPDSVFKKSLIVNDSRFHVVNTYEELKEFFDL